MKHHKLKTWTNYFADVAAGKKRFEIRWNDRKFQVGDQVTLVEVAAGKKTGRVFGPVQIDFILPGGQFGLEEGWVIFTWKKL